MPIQTDNLVINFQIKDKKALVKAAKRNRMGTAEFCRIVLKAAMDTNVQITKTISISYD